LAKARGLASACRAKLMNGLRRKNKNMKILSVDDKVENLYLLEAMLKSAGRDYEVVSAHNGIEALEKLDQDKFDLIISDILMPQMDGFELCRQVKQRDELRHVPFIFYTATYTEKKDEELGLRLGASRFIVKPLEAEHFLAVLREVIEEYEAGRLVAAPPPEEKEEVLLKAYNRSLVHKLDHKVQQLEQTAQELRQARDELARANTELEQKVEGRTAQLVEANANLQAFTFTAAHDLHAPLRAIQGFSRMVMEDYGDTVGAECRGLLERIVGAAAQMQRLLNGLLEYSKMSQAQPNLEKVSLENAVSDALSLLDQDIRARNAVVTVTPPLPEIIGNPAMMVLLINNFVSNALKFVSPGVQPQVRIWVEGGEGMGEVKRKAPAPEPPGAALQVPAIRLWVEDNGIGIAQKDLERIFGAFERLNDKQSYPGTGLGLAIARKGAERMGARVGVESELGKGSRFWADLRRVEN
jgi:signal transduction histidine kinase